MRIVDMKKKLSAFPSSYSPVHPSVMSEDEGSAASGSVNKAKVMELLGVASLQEYLEINDLLSRTCIVKGSSSCAHIDDFYSCDEGRSDDDIDTACALPLPFYPTKKTPSNSTCTELSSSAPVSLPGSHVTHVRSQHSPLVKAAFVQELAISHWAPKLLKFQCLAGMSLGALDSANGRTKSPQLKLDNMKGAKPTARQEGTFPLPPPSSEKHYLPRPLKIPASPVAHPLPPPLSRSTSNERAFISGKEEDDKVDMVHRRAVSCRFSIANESISQEVTALLPSPVMANLDMQGRATHNMSSSSEAPNYQSNASTSIAYKSPSPLLSARQSPRPSLPGSIWSLPNSPLRSPGTETLCPRKWQKGAILGQGTFGVVHEGLNLEDGSFFAIKVSNSADMSPEIQQEVDLLSKLEHPNIVRYLGSSFEDGRLCIFIELVRMGSLEKILRKYKRFEDNTIRRYTRQILLGLEYLHSKKTMHRDIKCANILVDVNGQVKLSDFGVAKEVDDTLASSLKGTPLYMAPEVLSAKNRYSFSADIWSLGCTVLEMADGKPPWSNLEGFGFLFKVKNGEMPPMPEHLSAEGKDFVHRCLKFNAKDRPTALELLQHPFVSNASVPEPIISRAPTSPVPKPLPFLSRSSWEYGASHLASSAHRVLFKPEEAV